MALICLVDVKQESFNRNSKITNSVIARVESTSLTAWIKRNTSEIMNNVNSPNGQGGFQSVSFRVCDCAVPEPRMKCSENGNTSYCGICSKSLIQSYKNKTMNDTIHYDGKGGWETESFRVNSRKIIENLKATRIHFLDTPAGRKWENIVAWKEAQKENKKVSKTNIDVISVLT